MARTQQQAYATAENAAEDAPQQPGPSVVHVLPGTQGIPIHRVRKAFEQIAEQLRDFIVNGDLPGSTRLPNENTLAHQFGVSRSTVREALRLLAAQNLIHTVKGSEGGSFVTQPTFKHIAEYLHSNLSMLTRSEHVSLQEFLEVRDLVEVSAARLAAERRTEEDLRRLWAAVPYESAETEPHDEFRHNRDFHTILLKASGNRLLQIAFEPVFMLLQTNLGSALTGTEFRHHVCHFHRDIATAVEAQDGDAAADGMREHLQFLKPYYEQVWKYAMHPADTRIRRVQK